MSALSDKVIALSKPYLGPATETFLGRQCQHLRVDMASLTPAHLKDLSTWVRRSGALIMDASKADKLANQIAAI